MAQAAELDLTVCNGDSRGAFIAGDAELARRFIASAWPYLCLPEALWPGSAGPKLGLVCHAFWKWSHTCFQLEQPEWLETYDCGSCPRLPGLRHGLTRYEEGWRCYRCGAQPFWPLHECSEIDAAQRHALYAWGLTTEEAHAFCEVRAPHLCTGWPDSSWVERASALRCWGGP